MSLDHFPATTAAYAGAAAGLTAFGAVRLDRQRSPNLACASVGMTAALLSFCALAVSVRALSGTLKVMEILAIRNGGGLVILSVLALFYPGHPRTLSARHLLLHALRNTIHFGGQFLWATAVAVLPLATVFSLEFTAPAHTALLSAVFLHERLTPSRLGVVIFGFLGVLVIVRPGLESFGPAAFLPLTAAFAFAVVLTQTKALIATETWFAILLWMSVIQLPLALLGSNPWSYLGLGVADLVPVGAVAVAGFTSQFCLAQAFRYGDATVVVPLDFIRIPLITLVGWWLYGEPLDAFVFLGVGGIVFSVLWNLRSEGMR